MSTAQNAIMGGNDAVALFAKAFCDTSSPFFGHLGVFVEGWEQDGDVWRRRIGNFTLTLHWEPDLEGYWASAECDAGEVIYDWTLECTVLVKRKKFDGALVIPGLPLAQAIAFNSFECLLDDLIDMRNKRHGYGPRAREGTLILAGAEWLFDRG